MKRSNQLPSGPLSRVLRAVAAIACAAFAISQESRAGQVAFAPPVALEPGHGVIAVEAGDVDGDGDLDVAVASLGGDVSILRNQGGAVFGPAEHYAAGSAHLEQVLVDLNADGRPDIALANFLGSNNVTVLLNQGDGTFGQPVDVPTPGVPNPRAIAAGDLDGDGDTDLLSGDGILTSKAVLLNDGSGAFPEALSFNSGGTSIQMAVGDLDGDGDLDAISVLAGIWLHRNQGDATFAPAVSLLAQQATAVGIADLDADGDGDVAVAISTTDVHEAAVFLNNGDGTAFNLTSYDTDTLARDIALADLDGDGHLDIATSHVASVNKVDVLLNQGDGTFVDGGAVSPGNYPQSLALGDFDGDGRKDIVTANQFSTPPSVGLLINETPDPAAFCDASDGSHASCPCSNPGAPDSGCDNAQGTGGVALVVLAQETAPNAATLQGTGFPGMASPAAIVLRADALDAASPVVFGDGLRCVGLGGLVRLAATLASGGISTHVFGHGAGPGSFHYQVWYRSQPASFCTSDAFNLSSGRSMLW